MKKISLNKKLLSMQKPKLLVGIISGIIVIGAISILLLLNLNQKIDGSENQEQNLSKELEIDENKDEEDKSIEVEEDNRQGQNDYQTSNKQTSSDSAPKNLGTTDNSSTSATNSNSGSTNNSSNTANGSSEPSTPNADYNLNEVWFFWSGTETGHNFKAEYWKGSATATEDYCISIFRDFSPCIDRDDIKVSAFAVGKTYEETMTKYWNSIRAKFEAQQAHMQHAGYMAPEQRLTETHCSQYGLSCGRW